MAIGSASGQFTGYPVPQAPIILRSLEADSIVVPIPSLKVSQERASFYLPMAEAKVKAVPLMPDQDYKWLADESWRIRNDALFGQP